MESNNPVNNEYILNELIALLKREVNHSTSSKTFLEAVDEYLNWARYNLSSKSISLINISVKHFVKFRGNINLFQFDVRLADQFLIYLQQTAPKGYRVYFRTLKAMFSKLVEWKIIYENPFAKIKLPKTQKNEIAYLTKEQIIFLCELEKNKTLKQLYLFDFYTGLRLSEITNLTWQDVNLNENYIRIGSEQFTTKTRKVRKVPLCEEARAILESIKPKVFNLNKSNYVFVKENGFAYSQDYISKSFKKLIKQVGFDENLHFHSIRHSTASYLANSGVPIPLIQQILGHSNIQTTMIYTHANFDELKKAVTVFDNNNLQINNSITLLKESI